jgi:hypothetical protein
MNMRTSKQISNVKYQSATTVQTPKLLSILEQVLQRAQGIYAMRGGVWGIVEKLRKSIKIPTGYQDEAGFHLGIEPAEKKVEWCRFGSLVPRRRFAVFHPFHNRPLGWQAECALTSQFNRLPSAYLMRRRET